MVNKNLIVYKNKWIIERIYAVSERIRNKVTDQTLFEERCIKRVAEYLALDESNSKNKRYIDRLINEVASAVVERNRNEYAELFTELNRTDDEGDEIEFEPQDVSANVEEDVIQRETAALLAQGDCKKEKILGFWVIGNTNSTHISRSLARTYGGNIESHRKYIQRFRKSCAEQLKSAI